MIDVFHADEITLEQIQSAENERIAIVLVVSSLAQYKKAARVKHSELDIAFAATGGPTQWLNADALDINVSPEPQRATQYGDILVEQGTGYVNLSTPAGFIPLVDVIEREGKLQKIIYS